MSISERNYKLTVTNGRTVTILAPIPIEFDIIKTLESSLPYMNLKVYGLEENERVLFEKTSDEDLKISITLEVGYGTDIKDVFNGFVRQGSNKVVDNINITEIDVYDGGFDYFYSIVNTSVTDNALAIPTVIETMPNTILGFISKQDELNRPLVLIGNSYDVLKSLKSDTQDIFFTDNFINILNKADPLVKFIPILSSANGLIDTITEENNEIEIVMDLQTKIYLGGSIILLSEINKKLNGNYKVVQIIAKGDYDGQDWQQVINAIAI